MSTSPFARRVAELQALMGGLAAADLSDSLALRAALGVTEADDAAFERARIEALCDAMESL